MYQPAGKWDYTNSTTHMERIRAAGQAGDAVGVSLRDIFLIDVDGVDALKAHRISVNLHISGTLPSELGCIAGCPCPRFHIGRIP